MKRSQKLILGATLAGGLLVPAAQATPPAPVPAGPASGLDTTFSGDGKVVTDFLGQSDGGRALALQPDGKVVVAGQTLLWKPDTGIPTLEPLHVNFAVVRYLRNGSLDPTFGGDGRVDTDFFDRDDVAEAVVIQPDGKIVVAGFASLTYNAGLRAKDADFALARYNTDGTLDATFGGDGKVTTNFGSGENSVDFGYSMELEPGGKIVVAGQAFDDTGTRSVFGVARYNTDGTLDAGFDGDGKTTTDFAGFGAAASSMAIQPNGMIVAAGSAYHEGTPGSPLSSDMALVRYTSGGELDPTFGIDGKVITGFDDPDGNDGATSVLIQPDGKIVASGHADSHPVPDDKTVSDLALVRYRSDGTLDPAFGFGGKTSTEVFRGSLAMVRQKNGTFVVAASDRDPHKISWGLVRYTPNGHRNGAVTTDFGGSPLQLVQDLAIQRDGKIVAGGFTAECNCHVGPVDFAVTRHHPNGLWNHDPHHCVNAAYVDLNQLFGITDQLTCQGRIDAGKVWRPTTYWTLNAAYDDAPPGFVPAGATPLADLVSKLKSVQVVVDPGTPRARTSTYLPKSVLHTNVTYDQFDPEAGYPPIYPVATSIPRVFYPLKAGVHRYEVSWILRAKHCDGFSADEASSCLPAGKTSFGVQQLEVTAP